MEKEEVKYQLPFDNGEKDRIIIKYNNYKQYQMEISINGECITVDTADIAWLREVLFDIDYIHKENTK